MAEKAPAEEVSASGVESLVGRTVQGKYRVIDVLGAGGMGRIYRAEQMPLGRPVALKVLHQELDEKKDKGDFQKRFLLEAATCAKLTHPNIVVVYDYGRLEGLGRESYFMAMELVEGITLGDAIIQDGVIAPARAMRIAKEIARALREAHRQGAVHRDLKPSNVMLTHGGEGEGIKVLDFGLVKLVRDDSEHLTQEDVFIGSPRYMAPEQIHRMPVDGRADLYALGVILYQMLCGQVPFAGDNPIQTLMGHVNEPVPPLRVPEGVELPPGLESIVMRCLAKDPDARFPNADALIHALQDVAGGTLETGESSYASGLRVATPREEPTVARSVRAMRAQADPQAASVEATPAPSGPSRGMKIAIFAGAVVIGGAASFFALRPEPSNAPPVAAHDTTPSPQPPADATSPAERPAEPPQARTFTLYVDSTPPGADLLRGEQRVGTTPTHLTLDYDALAAEPAPFRVELEGYVPYEWTQSAATDDVRVNPTLQRRRGRRPPGATMAGDVSPPSDVMIKTSR